MIYRICDWIGKLTGTLILTPHPYTVGNCAEHIYYGLIKARREKKKLVILFPYELPWKLRFPLTNIELVNVESEYRFPLNKIVYIVGRLLLTAYFGFFRAFSLLARLVLGRHLNELYRTPAIGSLTLWQPDERIASLSWDVVEKYEWRKQLQEPLQVSLGKQKKIIAEKLRIEMGLSKDDWFVCLHVREGGFHNDQCDERNANILNYIEAIEEVTSRGGWVVRMGDATMTKLPIMDRVIDYPFTEYKNALMDIYLISECYVYIGMTSGIFDVALLFQRPLITTNMSTWLYPFPQKSCDIGLFKHPYSKSRSRFLSIQEWLDEPFESVLFMTLGSDYKFYENDPQELKEVVREFFEREDNFDHNRLQHQFDELRVRNGRRLISESVISGDIFETHQRYRLASRLDSTLGMLGTEFLEKNWKNDIRNIP